MLRFYLLLSTAATLPATGWPQTLEQRIAAVESGKVRLSFAARPGVCGDGDQNINIQDSEDWEVECESQPVRVSLTLRNHQVIALRTFVGGHWRNAPAAKDLGTVGPRKAAAYFLHLAGSRTDLSGDPVLPATLADSITIWPSLLQLARSSRLPMERRRSAVFWLGQAAGAAVDGALDSIVGDMGTEREVRKQAVFALSQRSSEDAVPALIRIARTNRDPELRKSALFWLGQSNDPRAVDLFEEILR
ncbi:MAG: HEAT repeat domain-containing protein [Gemmatimonadales bacterium]